MAIVRVGHTRNSNTSAGNTITVSYSPSTGNTVIAYLTCFVIGGGTPTTMAVDDATNSYTTDLTPQYNLHRQTMAIFRSSNVTGGSLTFTGSVTGGGANFLGIIVVEYSGLDNSSPLDGTPVFATASFGAGGTMDSGPLSTSHFEDLLIGPFNNDTDSNGLSFSPGSGWTTVEFEPNGHTSLCFGLIDQLVSATGTYNATGVQTNYGDTTGVAILAYKSDTSIPPVDFSATISGSSSITATATLSTNTPGIHILIVEPGIGITDQSLRGYERNYASYSLTEKSRGTAQVGLVLRASDSYSGSEGPPTYIIDVSATGATVVLFAGTIDSVDLDFIGDLGSRFAALTLVSLEQCFDKQRIEVPRGYFMQSCKAIILDIMSREGAEIPVSLGTISDGPVVNRVYVHDRLSDILADLATEAGFVWYVDHSDQSLQYHLPTTIPTPFDLVTTDVLWESLRWNQSRQDFRDRQIIQLSPQAAPHSANLFAGDGATKDFTLDYPVESVTGAEITDSVAATATGTYSGQPTAGETISLSFVSPSGVAFRFSVSAPSTVTGAVGFSVTVTALDSSNNIVTTYAGTVHFTADSPNSGGLDVLPGDNTLVSGTRTFTGVKFQAGFSAGNTITVTDTVDPSITGTSGTIMVTPVP